MAKIAVCYIAHDDHWFLAESIKSYAPAGPVFVFLSDQPWNGEPGEWKKTEQIAKAAGAKVVKGTWLTEEAHRKAASDYLLSKGFTHAFIPDGDEIIEERLLQRIVRVAEQDLADRVYVEWDTYWHNPEYVIRPRERFTPCQMINLERTRNVTLRGFDGGAPLALNAEHGLVHHLSYAGPDERIRRKISTWSHHNELVPGWFDRVYKGWEVNKTLRELHPTQPQAYGFAERIHVPEILKGCIPTPILQERPVKNGFQPKRKRSVSVVIPLHGGEEDIRLCLQSLAKLTDIVHEVVVVDNYSPDNAAEVAESYRFVNVVRFPDNKGFAAACNRGIEATKGEVVIFLNSDTVVTRPGLERLLESLNASGSIAAAGPYTNRCGSLQQVLTTYTSLETLDLFAEDFAAREAEDRDVDMLVGFCLAVRRSVLNEIGGLDAGFGFGLWEDNDLCYRIRRAGYRLVISERAFIHHSGSKTLDRVGFDVAALLRNNEQYYRQKWQQDIDCGFASHLAGMSPEPIRFNPSRKPETLLAEFRRLAKMLGISLCMIVKNEERCLKECLESAAPFVSEIIVIDTGSSDRTKEIAKACGAKVYDFPWCNDFSAARNESMKYAKGKWIIWLDGDDVLPFSSGETLLRTLVSAMAEIVAYNMQVRFVGEGPDGGTMVDHIKVFRNLPGLKWKYRIHEQIIPALKNAGGMMLPMDAYVLHKNYDNSPEGQAAKSRREDEIYELVKQEMPDDPFMLFCLGMTYHFRNEHELAEEYLSRSLALSDPADSIVRKSYALKSSSQRLMGKPEEAVRTAEEGLRVIPDDPELHVLMGDYCRSERRFDEALRHYSQAVGADITSHFSSIDRGFLGFKTLHRMAETELESGRYPEAKKRFIQALDSAPTMLASAFALFEAAMDLGDYPTARQMMERVATSLSYWADWVTMARRYGESLGGTPMVLELLQQALNQQPAAWPARVELARQLLNAGETQAACQHFEVLQSQGIAEGAFALGHIEENRGNVVLAHRWYCRAGELNPQHEDTQRAISALAKLIEEEMEPIAASGGR
jgi:glycosyltransferase involved in cell wall biosynthesis